MFIIALANLPHHHHLMAGEKLALALRSANKKEDANENANEKTNN